MAWRDLSDDIAAEFGGLDAFDLDTLRDGYSAESAVAYSGGHAARERALAAARAAAVEARACRACAGRIEVRRVRGGPIPSYCGRKCQRNWTRTVARRAA